MLPTAMCAGWPVKSTTAQLPTDFKLKLEQFAFSWSPSWRKSACKRLSSAGGEDEDGACALAVPTIETNARRETATLTWRLFYLFSSSACQVALSSFWRHILLPGPRF